MCVYLGYNYKEDSAETGRAFWDGGADLYG